METLPLPNGMCHLSAIRAGDRPSMTGVSFGRQWLMTFGTSCASEEGANSPHGPNGLTTDRQTYFNQLNVDQLSGGETRHFFFDPLQVVGSRWVQLVL